MISSLDDYQGLAYTTAKKDMAKREMDMYCCMKLAEEAGELNGMIAKHYFHGKGFDVDNCKEELGDILWYVANLAKVNGFTLSEIATFNIDKLKKRHGDSYNRKHYTNE
jgi:NTP pyrophosphatase (non-canonical NTP hydrolase)